MVQCGFCGKDIPEGKNRNKIEKRFCNDGCRRGFHKQKGFERFIGELTALLWKYRFLFIVGEMRGQSAPTKQEESHAIPEA